MENNIDFDKSDFDYWMELANIMGWQLYGFTYKSHASYIRINPNVVREGRSRQYSTLEINSLFRDDIVDKFKSLQSDQKGNICNTSL